MNLLAKINRILKEQGLRSLLYIIGQKLKNNVSPGQKYAAYLRNERRRRNACRGRQPEEQFALLETGPDIFSGLEKATADFIAFVEPGDSLSEDWRQRASDYLRRNPRCRFLYTDEDRIEGKRRQEPVFKPDWSPDTYLSYDYVGGLMILERKLAAAAKEQICHGDQTCFLYELGLRASAMIPADQIGHLPEVLYHRKADAPVNEAYLLELKRILLQEWGQKGRVQWQTETKTAQVIYETSGQPLVSIIVPSRDHPELLNTCICSVERDTAYQNVEWIVVDNGSSPQNREQYERLCAGTRYPCRYFHEQRSFNFSEMCNRGAREAKGAFLLFLNDDMELPADASGQKQADWLDRMAGQASLDHAGAVGAKLLYPDSSMIQHIGIVNYTSGAACIIHNADVTGACLLVDRKKFKEVGGFCERLAVTFNDVDLCFRLLEAGYYNVVRSDVVWYHHESLSRGVDVLDRKKYLRGLKERELLFDMHPELIGVDPFYSPNLTQTRLDHTMDYPKKWRLSGKKAEKPAKEDGRLQYRILRIRQGETVVIEGWAYRKEHGSEPVTVLLEDQKGRYLAFETEAVYSPTLKEEQGSSRNLNFSEFFCRISPEEAPAGKYRLGLQIRDSRVMIREIQLF